MKTQITKLKNNLQTIVVDTEAFPSVTALLLIGAGSRYENKHNNGIAHFFEHMAFKGSKKYPNAFTLASIVEGLGGAFNAFTSQDHTGYYIKAPSEHLDTITDVIADMIQRPLLDKAEIEKEKGVIVEEINMYEDMPQRKVFELFENLLFKGNPLGFDIAGSKETVMSFNKKTFTDYIADLYYPSNAVFVTAGGFDGVKPHDIIAEKFSGWKDGKSGTFLPIKEKQSAPETLFVSKKTEQAHLCIGFRAFSYDDPRRFALQVLAAILGKGMSSRLFTEVREKRGLAYHVSTYTDFYADTGTMVTHAGIRADEKQVVESIKVILEEHSKILGGSISDEEIARVKELIKGGLILSMEDSLNVASFYGKRLLLQGEIQTTDQVIANLEKVTKEQVIAVAKDVFVNRGLNMALIGPFKSSAPFEKVLKI